MFKPERQFANDGFAVWLSGDNDKCKSDIHINEWIIKNDTCYIDFGIRVYDAHNVSQVNLYIPYGLKRYDAKDLSNYLLKEDIAKGIFNAPCIITPHINRYVSRIEYNNRTENILKLYSEYFYVTELPNETRLTINLKDIREQFTENEVYIRLRIPHKSITKMFKSMLWKPNMKNVANKIIKVFTNPVITKDYNYLMNINDVRLLPQEVCRENGVVSQYIQKIIVTLSLSDSFIANDAQCYKVRQLEEELYKEYVPLKFNCSDAIVYQWIKEREPGLKPHYNFSLAFKQTYINILSLVLYSLWAVVVSVFGNFIWLFFQGN